MENSWKHLADFGGDTQLSACKCSCFISVCGCAQYYRGTGARVWNEDESLRISKSAALDILSILRTFHHQLTPIPDSKADSQPQIYSQAATMWLFSPENLNTLHCCWNGPTSCDLLFACKCLFMTTFTLSSYHVELLALSWDQTVLVRRIKSISAY